jgi:hypothetical protein
MLNRYFSPTVDPRLALQSRYGFHQPRQFGT